MSIVKIDCVGTVRFIHSDELDEMRLLGDTRIRRASHVDWDNEGGFWTADMRPINGPVLGPYRLRKEALAAEHQWIEEFAL